MLIENLEFYPVDHLIKSIILHHNIYILFTFCIINMNLQDQDILDTSKAASLDYFTQI